MKQLLRYFTRGEWTLWGVSVSLILLAFLLFDRVNWLTLAASLIGVTSLLYNARGNPIGQCLMVIFSVLYGIISYRVAYYGEMITYAGMTGPMALFALIAWLRNPYGGNRAEVAVYRLKPWEFLLLPVLTVLVTAVFYRILRFYHTANLLPSTLSVTTSFVAVYLTFRRNPFFALAYAANDVILIVLWLLAAGQDRSCLSVVICFAVFLLNDLYGFVCWQNMRKRQSGR